MKRKISVLTACLAMATFTFGQDLTSKKGENYLPEEGDWAIGIDAAPFFGYLGNAFNGNTSNSAPTWSFVDPGMTIYGKWFKTDELAYRARLRLLGMNNTTNVMFSSDDAAGADPLATVEDAHGHSEMNISLGFGMEKRKGNTRLQGYYGAEVFFTLSFAGDAYSYGNDITSTNQNPSRSDFGDNTIAGAPGVWVTKRDYGTTYYAGLRPFIGAEYFIFPKISIGGEFGYTIAFGGNTAVETKAEYWDPVNGTLNEVTFNETTTGTARFIVDNDNLSGALKLMLHF